MSWSLLNGMLAADVEKLFMHKALREDSPDLERAISKETAMAIIHAALWAYSSRVGSTASAYAMSNLYDALGLQTWTFKPAPQVETGEKK